MLEKKSMVKARELFRQYHGILRTSRAIYLGIAPVTLYKMVSEGILLT